MSRTTVRYGMIALLAVAAVLSVVAKKLDSPWIGWVSVIAFIGAVFLYVNWRREVAARRRATVLDREAKTAETRTRTDE